MKRVEATVLVVVVVSETKVLATNDDKSTELLELEWESINLVVAAWFKECCRCVRLC